MQDPCHLRHVQHAEGAVRTVLRDGYDLVELDDDGLCCGAGGAYSVTEPTLSGAVRDRKVAAIRAVAGGRPFVVASANPGCAMHLAAAGLTVRHPAELRRGGTAVTGLEEIVEQLRTIEEQLRDHAYDRLREAAKGDDQAKADEKKLLQARRAIEKAIRALDTTDLVADDGP